MRGFVLCRYRFTSLKSEVWKRFDAQNVEWKTHLLASLGIEGWNVIAPKRNMYGVPMCSAFDGYGSRPDATHQPSGLRL